MSLYIMAAGALGKPPQQRTSKNGNSYVTASLRVTAGNEVEWWHLLCFHEGAQAEIMRLDAGEKLCVQGPPKIEIYRGGDGEQKISRTLMVDVVLALRQPPRERKPKAAAERATAKVDAPSAGERAFDDDIPF